MRFEEKTFAAEGAQGDWSDADRRLFAKLRVFYPELAHWGDMAIGTAFGCYSQDFFDVSWADWMLKKRDILFLCFCYWLQVHGPWTLGFSEQELEQANGWKEWALYSPQSQHHN